MTLIPFVGERDFIMTMAQAKECGPIDPLFAARNKVNK